MFKKLLSRVSSESIATTAVWASALRFGGFGLAFLSTLVLTNLLSTTDYGIYIYIFSVANLATLFVVLGADTLLLRQAAVYIKENKYDYLKGIVFSSFCMSLLFSVLLCLLIVAANNVSPGFIRPEYYEHRYLLFLLVPLFAALRLFQGLTRGLSAPLLAQFPDQIIRRTLFLLFLLLVAVILSFRMPIGAGGALLLQLCAAVIAVAMAFVICKRKWPNISAELSQRYEFSGWFRSSMVLSGTTLLQSLVAQLPILFLGYFATADSVAQYSVTERTGALINMFIIAINISIAGKVAVLSRSGETDALRKLATKSSRLAFVMALPIVLLFCLYAEQILALYSEEYIQSANLLRFVVIGYAIHIAAGPAAIFLQMTYLEKYTLYSSLGMFLFSLGLSALLSRNFQEHGAIAAYLISFLTYKMLIVLILRSKLGIDCTVIGLHSKNMNLQND